MLGEGGEKKFDDTMDLDAIGLVASLIIKSSSFGRYWAYFSGR